MRRTLLASALLGAGCAPSSPLPPPPRAQSNQVAPSITPPPARTARKPDDPPREPIEGILLVYDDARFYTWSDREHPRLANEPFDRERDPTRVVAAQALARRGNFYEVRLDQAPPGACVGASSFVRGHALDLYVHRRDVARVVVAPFAHTYDDGTRIALSPGLLAARSETEPDAPLSLWSHDLAITIQGELPELGEVFVPASKSPPPGIGKFLDSRTRDTLRFGTFRRGGTAIVMQQRPGGGSDLEITSIVKTQGKRTRARVDDVCASLEVDVDTSALKSTRSAWGTGFGCGRVRGSVDVPEGTPVFFPDGARAGTTTARRDIVVRNADWGENACYLVGTDRVCPDSGPMIELCVPRSALVAPLPEHP